MKNRDEEILQGIIEQLAQVVNNMAFDYKEGSEILADALVRKHRTLQQSTVRLLAGMIKEYVRLIDEEKWGTDLRNEACLEWARKVAGFDSYFPTV